jgi:hypothetical protein
VVWWVEKCGSVREDFVCSNIRVLFEREKAVRRLIEGNNGREIARRYWEWSLSRQVSLEERQLLEGRSAWE